MLGAIQNFLGTTGIAKLMEIENWWKYLIMYVIIGALFYLAIVKKFEPLLLLPIAFGMLLVNIYPDIMLHPEDASNGVGGLLYYFYKSRKF